MDIGADEVVPGVQLNSSTPKYASIQNAITAATSGNTITLAPGTYYETISFGSQDIVLKSTNPDDWAVVEGTVIDAQQTGIVVNIPAARTSACKLEGLTITGGLNTVPATNGAGITGNGSTATIRRCIIRDNAANYGCGAGLFQVHGLIEGCQIINNHASLQGGAIAGSNGNFRNCQITDNSAGQHGGTINNGSGTYINCTIANNTAVGTGGGFRWVSIGYTTTVTNCIIWGNTDGDSGTNPPADQIYTNGSTCNVTYSCVQGGWTGTGNINSNPLFVDADGLDNIAGTIDDNYHIGSSSPCIDYGYSAGSYDGQKDIDGQDRVIDIAGKGDSVVDVDMGADEYNP